MRFRYVAIDATQFALIAISGLLRRVCFSEIDFAEGQPMSPTLRASFYAFLLWFFTIVLTSALAVRDKENRIPVVLLLVILLPFVEFLAWRATSF